LWQANTKSGVADRANCAQNNQRKGDLKIKHCDNKETEELRKKESQLKKIR
jgi:hypothetical protein